jgi:hypothetical protein
MIISIRAVGELTEYLEKKLEENKNGTPVNFKRVVELTVARLNEILEDE